MEPTISLMAKMPELIQYFTASLPQSHSYFANIDAHTGQVAAGEERLYYVFLVTHFQSSATATAFYSKLPWKTLQSIRPSDLRRMLNAFFKQSRFIGDHRRHIRAMSGEGRAQCTYESIVSYLQQIAKYSSQATFFGVGSKPTFESLYDRMTGMVNLNSRIARFDHLENLSRTHGFYIQPPSTFYSEDASGPLDGLTYYYFTQKLRSRKGVLRNLLLSADFQSGWNAQTARNYKIISHRDDVLSIIRKLEKWLITNTRRRVPKRLVDDAFVYDLESCLCNWQKGKA